MGPILHGRIKYSFLDFNFALIAIETELKLTIDPTHVARFKHHRVLETMNAGQTAVKSFAIFLPAPRVQAAGIIGWTAYSSKVHLQELPMYGVILCGKKRSGNTRCQ
jgi:hypothetical protein